MNRSSRLVLAAALFVVPLGLAGCGVKGPLEAPGSAAAPAAEGPREARTGPAPGGWGDRGPAVETAAVESPAATRRSPLDWLID